MEEINVKIVKGIGGADCDIDVPVDATIGDVIVGLIDNGVLEREEEAMMWVLYSKDGHQNTPQGTAFDDRSKTVKEYGWQEGQVFIAVSKTKASY